MKVAIATEQEISQGLTRGFQGIAVLASGLSICRVALPAPGSFGDAASNSGKRFSLNRSCL
jgi:hypothetical protein